MIVDGVGYTPGQIRQLVQDRHILAEENTRLRLRTERMQRAAENQRVHLQRRTAALVRLIARKGPRLDGTATEPRAPGKGDRVRVVNRTDGWLGLEGTLTGGTWKAGALVFHGMEFPEFITPEGHAASWAQFTLGQLEFIAESGVAE